MKYAIALIALSCLAACDDQPFTGYIVGKEYIAGHWCHDNDYTHTVQAAYVHVPHTHHHKWQEPEFILHVANYRELRHIRVDSLTFVKYGVLESITLK